MRALILSCGTGGGHNAAGQAIADELKRRGHQATAMDIYQLAGEKTARLIGDAYIKLVQKSPEAFGVIYAMGDAYRRLPVHSPVYWANKRMAACTRQYLSEHRYDVILMTHMFPAQILTNLRKEHKGERIPPAILIATDYTCIPFMEEAVCDYYVIPSEELREEFSGKGIPGERILPFGIPVRAEFAEITAEEARKRLNLDPAKKYLLLSGGSIGAGKIEEAMDILQGYLEERPDHALITICGNNQKLYELLTEKYGANPQIRLIQSTPDMAAYMRVCKAFLTKPGGLSSTEAAVCGVPLIHLPPIPGCESRNAEFFFYHGMSLYALNLQEELLPALKRLESEDVCAQMRQAQSRCINGCATGALCDFLEETYRSTDGLSGHAADR